MLRVMEVGVFLCVAFLLPGPVLADSHFRYVYAPETFELVDVVEGKLYRVDKSSINNRTRFVEVDFINGKVREIRQLPDTEWELLKSAAGKRDTSLK